MPFSLLRGPRGPTVRLATIATFAVLAAAPAAAQSGLEGLDDLTVMGWSLSNVRGGVRIAPDYMGSDDYHLVPSGSLNLYRRGTTPTFGAPDDGVSVTLVGSKVLSTGAVGRWRSARDEEDDLDGFEDIDWAVEAGAFVNWWPADWARVRVEARRGFNGHESWMADLRMDAVAQRGAWTLSVGPRVSWADEDFTDTYFTVTPQEAARSPFGISPYAAEGSTVSVGALASAEYRMSRRWSMSAYADYRRLDGDAADSPIVADLGSRDQFAASLSVRYWFGR